ncbi:ribonucleoside-diphosphate reductase class II [Actinomadura madurae]|uniref:Vitamin B12-dependent ribonucleotide reductase n=1 Tax=Actinomadura madurae TaxID=1993 RepID=A0A1I5VX97_9ACTN|nr:vitamin B12-dependent ribonucleotide reductase [Actinomadura madurae]SFQ12060.1 ribonucleoside-diphosphate reductase class II [Actinomadura madurae]
MTETVSGSAARRGKGGRKGLKVERIFTTPGVHPYDELRWERRDVVMTNWRDGSVNFEQRGVEFPDFWSLNAVNIVTSKYFRGAVGTPQREWSLKQLVDRVARMYVETGLREGYFASEQDAEVFDHELKYALVHQLFSFNSPVWFNVGTKSPQQVSACLPYESLVSTPAGLIPIGKLVEDDMVGTKVYDASGLTRIVATKANGRKDVLRIHTKAGYTLDVTADHLVWKATGDGTGSFVQAGELKTGDLLEWHRRDAFGDAEISPREMSEAALAGWLQSDGFVGRYETGTNRSLTIEAMTVTDAELEWVGRHLNAVFPGVHRHERTVETQDAALDCRRTRLYGKPLEEYVDEWGLLARGVDMVVPERLFTASLPTVACYLRSIFQAEGFVSERESSTVVEVDMISEKLIRGMQRLLLRFGIFSRVGVKKPNRPEQKPCWTLRIQNAGDRRIFADEIGFIDPVKALKLHKGFEKPGRPAKATKRLQIAQIEQLGTMEVYDIQTESGEFLSDNIRVHNCFILSVDDTMESILDWYKEEGVIFKGGSGAGLNLSRIRSSRELLSSGGTASGPVSFMRGADASAGTIKSGGATRRAAKMVVLDVDHPDIGEFIETKAREEDKIRALRDAGFDMDLGGKDIGSVQYQNANNSVRVSDEFMHAVESDGEFGLRARMTGEVVDTVKAKDLFRLMAKAAWECADPGIQYDDTINDWHTNPETGRITASNPCSEYMSLDNSSCNLASINLLKFLTDAGTFDVAKFVKLTELIITAMDISITFADFPTEKIAQTTRDYRQLGIGYANLGALLMATGHAYDSEGGRSLAAAVTSLMTGVAYRRSAEIAGVVGPYAGYARNAEAHKRVMRKHAAANDGIRTLDAMDKAIHAAAAKQWADCLKAGEKHGYRNAQASLLAPTGTIGLMMDCDTTGIEPDLALMKFKKLVGGGSMQIVNQTVPRALEKLGYPQEQIEAIVEYIAEHGHVVDAPGLRPDHYEVFDCAMGERAISPMGHVRMMAAVQPFLSGAISKTVNMPEQATIEDIEKVYFEGWRLGLKALAIYRDNCKVGQPLSAAGKKAEPAAEAPAEVVARPVRKRLPKQRPATVTRFSVAGAEGYMTASSYPDDGVGEVFLKLGKQGSTLAGVMDAFSMAISISLQYGVPLETWVEKFTNMRFEPAGMTDDPDIRMATSVMDYIFRRLALDHLPYEERAGLGIFTAEERAMQANGEDPAALHAEDEVDHESLAQSAEITRPAAPAPAPAAEAHSSMEVIESRQGRTADAPLCLTCGTKMRPAGSCYVCEGCGSTSGCS